MKPIEYDINGKPEPLSENGTASYVSFVRIDPKPGEKFSRLICRLNRGGACEDFIIYDSNQNGFWPMGPAENQATKITTREMRLIKRARRAMQDWLTRRAAASLKSPH